MNIEQLMDALAPPPEPAAPVLTMPATLAERIAEKLAGIDLHGSELSELRAILAEPVPQLWAIHSPGPGETYPCLNREDAEKQAAKIADYVEQTVGERPVVNVIPSPWDPAEHFEIMAGEWLEDAEAVREKAFSLQARVAELEALIAKQAAASPPAQRQNEPQNIPEIIPAPEQPVTATLKHSTKENGDCPSWCKACAAEIKQRALLEANK